MDGILTGLCSVLSPTDLKSGGLVFGPMIKVGSYHAQGLFCPNSIDTARGRVYLTSQIHTLIPTLEAQSSVR